MAKTSHTCELADKLLFSMEINSTNFFILRMPFWSSQHKCTRHPTVDWMVVPAKCLDASNSTVTIYVGGGESY